MSMPVDIDGAVAAATRLHGRRRVLHVRRRAERSRLPQPRLVRERADCDDDDVVVRVEDEHSQLLRRWSRRTPRHSRKLFGGVGDRMRPVCDGDGSHQRRQQGLYGCPSDLCGKIGQAEVGWAPMLGALRSIELDDEHWRCWTAPASFDSQREQEQAE